MSSEIMKAIEPLLQKLVRRRFRQRECYQVVAARGPERPVTAGAITITAADGPRR
jgi:hypothetical protein